MWSQTRGCIFAYWHIQNSEDNCMRHINIHTPKIWPLSSHCSAVNRIISKFQILKKNDLPVIWQYTFKYDLPVIWQYTFKYDLPVIWQYTFKYAIKMFSKFYNKELVKVLH
jgi:hypothetical protein